MKAFRFCLSLLIVASSAFAEEPQSLDAIFQSPNPWESTSETLNPLLAAMKFEWTSTAKDTARSAAPGLTFVGLPTNEVLFRFQDGKFASADIVFYNRGDAGELGERDFTSRLAATTTALSNLIGSQPKALGRDASSAVRAEGAEWSSSASRYLLEWSYTRESRTKGIPFRSEFIRLTIAPPQSPTRAIGATPAPSNASRDAVKKFSGPDHVTRAGGSTKIVDVPMVDQGQKGYCVVATVERVMRYFGSNVDQHELAQIANSDSGKGTSMDAMTASLKTLTARLGVKLKSHYEWDIKEFLDIMGDYNRATKRGKEAPEINLGGQIIDISECLARVKPELFKEVRLKKSADFGRFQRDVQRSIDEGIPLLWTVQLGIVKEPGLPQVAGGHMRLIIGYNPATKSIIYSDSWGMGHEEKQMSFEDAWTITTGLSALQPIGS